MSEQRHPSSLSVLRVCATGRKHFVRRYRRHNDGSASFRHYVRVGPLELRVPWLAWALFS